MDAASPPAAHRDAARIIFDTVSAHDASLAFGATHALRRVDFRARRGEVVGVYGHNGAGKTSLFRVLSTLQRPTRGEVCFDDQPVHRLRPIRALRASIGMLGHASFLYPELDGHENLDYYGRLFGIAAQERARLVEWALRVVGMWSQRDRLVRVCSRGMVQRLAFARLLVQDPVLWLLDEPMTGLDQETRERIESWIPALAQKGAAVVLISHDDALLERVATRRVVLQRGRITEAE